MNKWLWIFFVYALLPCNHCNYLFTSEQSTSSDDDKSLRRVDTPGRARRQEKGTTAGRSGSRQRVFTFPNSLSNTVYFGNGDDELTDGEISVSGPQTLWSINAKSNLRRSPTWYSYNHRVIPSKEPMISHIMKYSADPVGYSNTFVSGRPMWLCAFIKVLQQLS
ncbi:hypothetical protein D918_00993 [Trichuris suis]|nr:hypothetical protein D918_00993 [Trichuris suis]